MKTKDLISMSVRSLWRRKLRTCLTILGVVIGATSIVLMLSLGFAMEKNMEEQFASWGDLTLINIYSYGGDSNSPDLDEATIKELKKLDHVTHVIPRLETYTSATIDKYFSIWGVEVRALEGDEMEALGYKLEEGEFYGEGAENVAVIGGALLRDFQKIGKKINWDKMDWGNMERLEVNVGEDKISLQIAELDNKGKPELEGSNGKIKKVKPIDLRIVGLLGEDNWEYAETIFISRPIYDELVAQKAKYEKAMWGRQDDENGKKQNGKVTYDQLTIKVDHRDNVTATSELIEELGFGNVDTNMTYLEQAQQQAKGKRMALGGIGIVSFFVAAIGIANTMMMSIYERTKEIGVMKVIGAKLRDIKHMFLLEALMIGFIGGIAGCIISLGLSMGMNAIGEPIARLMDMETGSAVSIVPVWLLIGAIGFSTFVGLISGYFPAKKAMKLSALTAIKTE